MNYSADLNFKNNCIAGVLDFNENASVDANFVVFHHSDMDGIFAAASLYVAFSGYGRNVRFKEVNYNSYTDDDILDFIQQGDAVLVVDFAFSAALSDAIYAKSGFFVTIDHHASSQREIGDKPYAIFDMTKSGAKMTFEWAFPYVTDAIPLAVTLADARDMWDKTDPRVDQFHQYTTSRITEWKQKNPENKGGYIEQMAVLLFDDDAVNSCCELGAAMLKKMYANIHYACTPNNRIHTTIGGHPAVVVNYPVDQSDACQYLYEQPEYAKHICATVSLRGDSATFSLRKNKDFDIDLSSIAEASYGGGGHKAAAGFKVSLERGMNILQNKEKWALCMKTTDIFDALRTFTDGVDLYNLLSDIPSFLRSRAVCETDTSTLQLLPYVVLRDGATGDILSYRRPDTGTEQRLHGKFSIGFGGHIDNSQDARTFAQYIGDEAGRELQEELGIDKSVFDVSETVRTLFANGRFSTIHVKTTPVDEVHFALVFIVTIEKGFIGVPEELEVRELAWLPVETLIRVKEAGQVETWSAMILENEDL